MTVEEVAEWLGFSLRTIYEKVQRKEIPHLRIGRSVRFRKEALEAWIVEHPEAERASA